MKKKNAVCAALLTLALVGANGPALAQEGANAGEQATDKARDHAEQSGKAGDPKPSGPPLEMLTSTGAGPNLVPEDPLTAVQQEAVDEKAALIAQNEAHIKAKKLKGGGEEDVVALACPAGEPCTSGPAPSDFKIPAAANTTVQWQLKHYTCGPASLLNMVRVMSKVRTGSYSAQSEGTYESWLGTTTQGTGIVNIANVLNNRYSHFGSWSLRDPADKHAYLSMVVTDTYNYKQPLIQGVRTSYLSYFSGHDLNHFNFVYGYQSSTTTKRINVGEVWDPVKVYGSSSYNPYGHRVPPLQEVFDANNNSGPGIPDRRRLIV